MFGFVQSIVITDNKHRCGNEFLSEVGVAQRVMKLWADHKDPLGALPSDELDERFGG